MAAEAHEDTSDTAPCSGTRVRHEPENTVLYPIVAEYLETFLAETAAPAPAICAQPPSSLLVPTTDDRPRHATFPWRLDWATLLRRTWDIDALACPRCGGRLQFVELLELPHQARTRTRSLHDPGSRSEDLEGR